MILWAAGGAQTARCLLACAHEPSLFPDILGCISLGWSLVGGGAEVTMEEDLVAMHPLLSALQSAADSMQAVDRERRPCTPKQRHLVLSKRNSGQAAACITQAYLKLERNRLQAATGLFAISTHCLSTSGQTLDNQQGHNVLYRGINHDCHQSPDSTQCHVPLPPRGKKKHTARETRALVANLRTLLRTGTPLENPYKTTTT